MLDHTRKADVVADDLLTRIVSGALPVGTLLPRESDLAKDYGVNRSVVREANKLLEVHRLVEPVRRRGTQVLDPLESITPAVLRAMLTRSDATLDRAMFEEFLEIRALLDVEMAVLAAVRHTDDDLEQIEAALAKLEAQEPGTPEAHAAADGFGLALARATHNRLFSMLAHWHRQITEDFQPLLSLVRTPVRETQGYYYVIEAIRSRDGELARQLVRGFHDWANERLLESIDELEPCALKSPPGAAENE